jgi:HSP20 family protein
MATSFFEKLTGASDEEEDVEIPKTDSEKKTKKTSRRSSDKKTKDIKKDYIEMPKTKDQPKAGRSASTKRNESRAEKLVKKIEPEIEKEDKDWLEEAEGEEGQLTIDVYQTDSDIVIKSTIAGVNPEDIDISIANDMVTIRGKRAEDEKIEAENYYYQELYWGAFSRSVILPIEVDTDKAKASIKNGILTIKLPKSEKVKTKKIRVSAVE